MAYQMKPFLPTSARPPILALFILANGGASAATVVRSGIEFCIVGAAGNREPNASEMPDVVGNRRPGAVGYEYALAKTETTAAQYLEFLRAYSTFHPVNPFDGGETGSYIYGETTPLGLRLDLVSPTVKNRPSDFSWRMAARLCNWLHNDKAMTKEAFERGAYDTSTFGRDASGLYTDQIVRSAGAKFWIPNADEWVKGAYYDPNRYGQGLEGYWRYSGKSEVQLKAGSPLEGGQTNAGDLFTGDGVPLDVGSYQAIQSAWGLLDTCGGQYEWLDGLVNPNELGFGVDYAGARIGNIDAQVAFYDKLGHFGGSFPIFGSAGLRLATIVPAPGSLLVGFGGILTARRKRR